MKYRKKPVVIDVIQWVGSNWHEIQQFVTTKNEVFIDLGIVKIYTLEGIMEASKGDYIIKGVQGEFYPCKPDIFELTYEKAE